MTRQQKKAYMKHYRQLPDVIAHRRAYERAYRRGWKKDWWQRAVWKVKYANLIEYGYN